MNTLDEIQKAAIVPVVRKANEGNILNIVEALYTGGVKIIEITADSANFTDLMKIVQKKFPKNDLYIGVGTVLDAETARTAILSGAQFIVTPTLNEDTIKVSKRYGIPIISGAFTPTEILKAREQGADMVKVFPASILGPSYIKTILSPLPNIPIMVTGGITIDNMTDYLAAGSIAVGIGSDLVNTTELNASSNYDILKKQASIFVNEIRSWKQSRQ